MRKTFVFACCVLVSLPSLAQQPMSAGCTKGIQAFLSGDYVAAATVFEPLALQGDACAQTRLAYLYAQGRGIPVDKEKASQLWQAAAAQGNQEAAAQAALLK